MKKILGLDTEDIFLILILAVGIIIRVSLLGIHHYPGNLRAADAVNHPLVADYISQTENYKILVPQKALGRTDVINVLPPSYYLHIASISKLTGIEPWNVSVFFGLLYNALLIAILYLFASKVFDSKGIGLIAASLFVMPLNMDVWTYYSYIGMVLQAAGNLFLAACIYYAYDYLIDKKPWKLNVLVMLTVSTYLLHFSELIPLVPLYTVILITFIRQKPTIKTFKTLFVPMVFSLLPVILYFPRVLVWIKDRGENTLGFHIPSVAKHFAYPGILDISIPLLILFAIGLIQLFLNRKKYTTFILFSTYLFAYLFISPFLSTSSYFLRHKSNLPILIFPIIGYILFYLIVKNVTKHIKLKQEYLTIGICLIIILAGIPGFLELKSNLSRELVSENAYLFLESLKRDSDPDDKFLFVEGFYQGASEFVGRFNTIIEPNQFPAIAQYILGNNFELPQNYFCKNRTSFMLVSAKEESFMDYQAIKRNNCPKVLSDYDYVVFSHLNAQIFEVNQVMMNYLLNQSFQVLMDQNNIVVMKKL